MSRTWPPPSADGVVSALEGGNATDGSWLVYDPGARLVGGAVTRVNGTHKHLATWALGLAGTTMAQGITLYRRIRDADGNYPSNERGCPHRITAAWAGRLLMTSAHRMILLCGYASGPPTDGASIVRLYGMQDGTAGNIQVNGRMFGTVAASTYSPGVTSTHRTRQCSVMLPRMSNQCAIPILPGTAPDGNRDGLNTVRNTYTANIDEEFGNEAEVYEYIYIGCGAVTVADVPIYFTFESGLIGPNDSGYHYSPEMGGAQEPLRIYCDGDSRWFGGAGGGGAGGYPGLQRALAEFELRRTSGARRQPVHCVGYTGSGIGVAPSAFGVDGQVDTGAASGRALTDSVADIAARMTSIGNAGRDLRNGDLFLLFLGTNDAVALRTEPQMRADVVTIAGLVKAAFPNCRVIFAFTRGVGFPQYILLWQGIVASLPANVDGYLDFASWFTDAFVVSGPDSHPSLPPSPTGLAAWDPPLLMDPAAADFTQYGICAMAYHLFRYIHGVTPPLLAGEVAPV
jgi:hypothetical protein